MKLEKLLIHHPRVKIGNENDQESIFSIIDQTSISSESLQISFERKPNFYHFLKAQGHRAFVFQFLNHDKSVQGFGVSTFRKMQWKGKQICLGYTSDLRTTPQLDREARLQWRKFYGDVVGNSPQIEDFDNCIGFVTAVWNENNLAQKALVKKKRPGDFSYEKVNSYKSYSIWGRWKPLIRCTRNVRPIRESEVPLLINLLCNKNDLSWDQDDLIRTLLVFKKSFHDFFVLEENGDVKAYVLPAPTSDAKKTIIKKWPFYLKLMARLLPLFGKQSIRRNEALKIQQLLMFTSVSGDENSHLLKFIEVFWYQNNKLPQVDQFSILTVNLWDKHTQKPLSLKKSGFLFTTIDGSLYKVNTEKKSSVFEEINDFNQLEIGFL